MSALLTLVDSLIIGFQEIDSIKERFEVEAENIRILKEREKYYKGLMSLKDCLISAPFMFIFFMLITGFLFMLNLGILAILLSVLFTVIFELSAKVVYTVKILPKHLETISKEYSKTVKHLQEDYARVIELKDSYKIHVTPVMLYMIRGAVEEGSVTNLTQGINYFEGRYKTLEMNLDNEEYAKVKASVDKDKDKDEERQKFMDEIDDLFKEAMAPVNEE